MLPRLGFGASHASRQSANTNRQAPKPGDASDPVPSGNEAGRGTGAAASRDSHTATSGLNSRLREIARAVGFDRRHAQKARPDPLEGMTEAQRTQLRKVATAALCDKVVLEKILGQWPSRSRYGSYEQDYLRDLAGNLSRTSKSIRKAMLPVLAAALLYCHYNRVFVYTSSIPNGWLKFKGTDRLAFGRWVTEQVLPRRIPGYASVLTAELRAGFMKDVIIPATQAAFQHYVHQGDLGTAKRMLTSGLVSPFNSFDEVKPLFLLVSKKVKADYLDEICKELHKLDEFKGYINHSDGHKPPLRLLDYALECGNQAVIDVLRKHGAVTHDIDIPAPPPTQTITWSDPPWFD